MTTLITCNTCGEMKTQSDFPKNGKFPDGETRYRPDCKVCYAVRRRVDKKKLNNFRHNHKNLLYTAEDWKRVMIHFRGRCAYCGEKVRGKYLTKDHVIPVSEQGPTLPWNIVPACSRCNCSKANNPVKQWWMRQKYWSEERYSRLQKWVGKREETMQHM